MQTFTSGLTVSGSTSYVRDVSASGLITANGGLKVATGQTLDVSGATISGLFWALNPNVIYVSSATGMALPVQSSYYNWIEMKSWTANQTLTISFYDVANASNTTHRGQIYKINNITGYS
jgi:hypothetical protein